jgi:ABC-type Mn2+/Zn2+ transport system ATPase subunit
VSPEAGKEPLVSLASAQLGYGQSVILSGVDLRVDPGDFLAIIGPNGSGKTTLLRAILGVLPPQAGSVERQGRIGYAPQRSSPDPVFPLRAREVVAMGLLGAEQQPWAERHVWGPLRDAARSLRLPVPDDAVRERSLEALEACGIGDKAEVRFRDLSGGQKQRVLVARALVSEPDVLVLDEPTNDLDLRGEHEVMQLVRTLWQGGKTVIMVSHLLHVVARYAQRLAFIHDGGLREGSAEEMLTQERLQGLYGIPVEVGELAGFRTVAPADDAPGGGDA